MAESYYDILKVNKNASMDEIKKSYRKLSLLYHPDKNHNNPDTTKQFQKITEAYERIGTEEERKKYDSELNNPFHQSMNMNMNMNPGQFPFPFPFPFAFHEAHQTHDPMEDMFSQIFGNMDNFMGGGGNVHMFHNGRPVNINVSQSLQKPTPIVKTLEVTLDKVYNGDKVPLELERWNIENGVKVFETETVYVTIPKGIDDNEIIILRDKGNSVNNKKGDVKIFIKIEKHKTFIRNGLDLIFEKKISLKESLCGFSFDFKHINNKVYTINNSKGNVIPNAFKKVLPNMGLTREEYTGSLIFVFEIEFPETLSMETINVIETLL